MKRVTRWILIIVGVYSIYHGNYFRDFGNRLAQKYFAPSFTAGNMTKKEVEDLYRRSYKEKRVPIEMEGLLRPWSEWPSLPPRPEEIELAERKHDRRMTKLMLKKGFYTDVDDIITPYPPPPGKEK